MKKFKGRIAVVTGSQGGIGRSVVKALCDEGALVIGLDRVSSAVSTLDLTCDIGVDSDVEEAASIVKTKFGDPHFVVHAAAASDMGTAAQTHPEVYQAIYNVNVVGAVRLLRSFAPAMSARRAGSFVFISSVNASFATPGLAAYAASKAALDSLVQTAAVELGPDNVRVNSVRPASVETPLLLEGFARTEDPIAARSKNILRHPLGRLGQPTDIARLVLFLLSDEASWITGSHYSIDGGAGATRR
jgi:NAD(P)-dependent dehydrogenase (short-subunit alcohol dehydrogenase family)